MTEQQQRNVDSQRRFRASHRRIDYAPRPAVLAIIDQHLFGDLGKSITGVLDQLVLAGHAAITGNSHGPTLLATSGSEDASETAHRRLTPLQEDFARCVATENQSLTASYRATYAPQNAKPETVNKMAAELAAVPKVAARIRSIRESLTAAVVEKTAYSRADAIEELGRVMQEATARGQIGAAVAAVRLRAQLAGHLPSGRRSRGRRDASPSDLQPGDAEALAKMLEEVEAREKASAELPSGGPKL